MAFQPLPSPPRRSARLQAMVRYAVTVREGRAKLLIQIQRSLLERVKGQPRFWRLDIDKESLKARLTGLFQDDGEPATKPQPTHEKPDIRFIWVLPESHMDCFPDTEAKVKALTGEEVTSMGVEFNLPE